VRLRHLSSASGGDLSTSPLGCIGTLVSSQLLTWLAYVLLAPMLAVAISGVYFVASPRAQPTRDRILASAHGVAMALLYVVAWIALLSGQSNPRLGTPFGFSLLLPLCLIILSFFFYRARKVVHCLQIINVVCLLWTGFAGGMLITGESP
jgi:hypothetical protein